MKIIIECDECKKQYEITSEQIYCRDTTPCSCGCCHGEEYTISLGKCPHCGKEHEVIQ